MEIAVDDPEVNELLKSHLGRLVSSDGALEVVTIEKIKQQVVSGMKYDISASIKSGSKTSECKVLIWVRSWLKDPNEQVKIKAECPPNETIHTQDDDGIW